MAPEFSVYQKTIREAGEAFLSLYQIYQFCIQRTLRKYGLYPGQPALLFALSKAEEDKVKLTQNDLANVLGVSRASAGVSIRRLEKAGFVKRTPDSYDTRCNRISLTQKGREFAHWCELDMDMICNNMMEDFGPEERVAAVETLRRMSKGLQAMRKRIES